MFLLNTLRERDIGLGRQFTKTVLGKREILVTKSTLAYLDVNPDVRAEAQFQIDFRKILDLVENDIELKDG